MNNITKETIQKYLEKLHQRGERRDVIEIRLKAVNRFIQWGKKRGLIEKEKAEEILKVIERELLPIKKPVGLRRIKILLKAIRRKISFFGRFKPRQAPYRTYEGGERLLESLGIQHYIAAVILLVFVAALGVGIYNQFFKKAETPFAYPTTPTRGGRIISFQGRLTDSLGNPITTSTNVQFKLYDVSTGGTALYSSGSCSITPDQDGIFSVLIGQDCGSEIPNSVFTENANVYLGVTVGTDSEMTPRQQIANVGYAINAETLQGLPPGTTTSTIPYINADGDLLIAAASPGVRSINTSANFALSSAKALTLTSASTGDIVLQATESGTLKFRTGGATDVYNRLVVDTNGNVGINTSTPQNKLDVNGAVAIGSYAGSTSAPADSLIISGNVGIGTTSPSYTLDVAGQARIQTLNAGSTDTVVTHSSGVLQTRTIDSRVWGSSLMDNWVLSADTGTNQTVNNSETVTIAGGTNGIDTVVGATNTVTLNLDWTEVADQIDFAQMQDTLDLDANLTVNQGGYTWVQNFTGTTGTGLTYNANSLTSGKGLSLSSASTGLTTGNLLSVDWSPASSTTATGDLVSINVGANGTVGNLLNIKNNGSPVFKVSQTQIESAVPHTFTSSGDVSLAYDLIFTNQTSSKIESYGPFSIVAGESFESNDLTLSTYNAGDIVLDAGDASGDTGTIKFYDAYVKGATDTTPIAFSDSSADINTYRSNYTNETIIGALNEVYSAATGGGGGIWTDAGTYIYPTDAGDYGGTGLRITDAGDLLLDGTLTVDSTSTLTGLVTMTNGFDSNAASTVAGLTVDGSGSLTVSDGTTSLSYSGASAAVTVTNTGTGNSFVVNDQASDTTPFVIDAGGNVGIGTTSPVGKLHVLGECVAGETLLPIKRRRKKKKGDGDDDDEELWEDLLVPIRDVQPGDLVASLDEATGKIVYRPIRKLMHKGVQKVVKIVTASGRRIETTLNHPYLTEDKGWVKVSGLKVGTKIAVPERKSKQVTYAFIDASNMIYRNTDENPVQLRLYRQRQEWGYRLRLNKVKQLFGYKFSRLDDTQRWLGLGVANKKEAEPTNVSASGITGQVYQKANDLSDSRIAFEEIVSIEETGRKEVYDIEVEGTHNFVAGHLINQKTGKALNPQEEKDYLKLLAGLADFLRSTESKINQNKSDDHQSGNYLSSIDKLVKLLQAHNFSSKTTAKYKNIIERIRRLVNVKKSGAAKLAKNQPAERSEHQEESTLKWDDLSRKDIEKIPSELENPVKSGDIIAHNTYITSDLTVDTDTLFVDSTNNRVGIGTTNPAQKLHVEGQCVTGDTQLLVVSEEELLAQEAQGSRLKAQGSNKAPSELVQAPSSRLIKIKDIKPGSYVFSLDPFTGETKPARVKALLDMGVKPVFRLTTEDGRTIRTTGNHPYLAIKQTPEGINQETYKAANSKGARIEIKRSLDGKKVIWDDKESTTGLGGLRGGSLGQLEGNIDQRDGNQEQRHADDGIGIKIPEIKVAHNRLSNLYDTHHQNIPAIKSNVKSPISLAPLIGQKLGETKANTNHAADKLLATAEQDFKAAFRSLGEDKNLIRNDYNKTQKLPSMAKWTKVIYLSPGDEIAVVDDGAWSMEHGAWMVDKNLSSIRFERIASIEFVGYEHVYDIEVEDTHNFVAGHLINQETGKALNPQEEKEYLKLLAGLSRFIQFSEGNDYQSKTDQPQGKSQLGNRDCVGEINAGDCHNLSISLSTIKEIVREIIEKNKLTVNSQIPRMTKSDPNQPAERLENQEDKTLNWYGLNLREKDIKEIVSMVKAFVKETGIEINDIEYGGIIAHNTYISDKLGVGTQAVGKLHVQGAVTGKALAVFNETGDQDILTASASGQPKFVVAHSGNVGIGTTNPLANLQVVGQCVTGDTKLRRRRRRKRKDGGWDEWWEEVPIKDIKPGDEIQTLDETTGRLITSKVKALMDMGTKPIFKLTTASGKTIRTTGNHPYLVAPAQEKQKVAVFIDGANFEISCKRCRLSKDYQALIESFFGKQDKIQLYFYKVDFGTKRQHKFFDFLNIVGAKIVSKPLKVIKQRGQDDLHKGNFDVEISFDAAMLKDDYDTLVLFSGDSDFTYMASGLQKIGKKIVVISPWFVTGRELRKQADLFMDLRNMPFVHKKAPRRGNQTRLSPAIPILSQVTPFVKGGKWTKVSQLRPGQMIAVVGQNGKPVFERIKKIEKLPAEQVYDIEVEGTHNFVGNEIVAHNTYISGASAALGVGYDPSTITGGVMAINGNVGIGTTAPSTKLDVSGSARIYDQTPTTGVTTLTLRAGAGQATSPLLQWQNNAGTGLGVIDAAGNVGIGTTSPGAKLTVVDNGESTTLTTFTQAIANAGLLVQTEYTASAYTPGLFWVTSNNNSTKPKAGIWLLEDSSGTDMYFGTSNSYATGITNNGLVLDQSGNVGIGTTGPGAKLDVRGNTILFGGAAYGDSALSIYGTNGNNDAAITMAKENGTANPVFSILPWDSQIYISAGTYFSNGSWIQDSDNAYNQIFVLDPAGGVRWYASNNAPTAWWGLANNEQLWNDYGIWTNLVQSTRSGNSYFTGGNVGIGTTGPGALLNVGSLTNSTQAFGDHPALFVSKPTQHTVPTAEIKFSSGNPGCSGCQNIALKVNVDDNQGSGKSNIGLWVDAYGAANNYAAIFNTGNVGIGTTGPGYKLQIDNGDIAVNKIGGLMHFVTQGNGTAVGINFDQGLASGTRRGFVEFVGNNTLRLGNTVNSPVEFYSQGSLRLSIDGSGNFNFNSGDVYFENNSGNVGIGTTSPGAKLTVVDNGESTTLTTFTQAIANAGLLVQTEYTASAYTPGLFWVTSNNNSTKPKAGIWLLEDSSGTDMYFGTSNSYATGITNNGLVLDQSGNVGIGTTNPSYDLEVSDAGTDRAQMAIYSAGDVPNDLVFGSNGQKDRWSITSRESTDGNGYPLTIWRNNGGWSRVMTMDYTNGNVGIGTTSPVQKLHVEGQCVTGDTELYTASSQEVQGSKLKVEGKTQIKDLKPGSLVYSYNEETKQVEARKVWALLDMGVKPVFKLITKTGKLIRTTGNHPYLTILKGGENRDEVAARRIAGLAGGDGVDTHSLQADRDVSQGRALWVDRSNEQSGSFNRASDSRGQGALQSELLPGVSLQSQRQSLRNSHLSNSGSETGLFNQSASPGSDQQSLYSPEETVRTNQLNQEAKWTKVIYLKEGDLIAVSSFEPRTLNLEPYVLWDEIVSIEYVGEEQVYDISVEGTKNFFGNGILAHNTYLSGNVGIGTTSPDSRLHLVGGDLYVAPDTGYSFTYGTANEDLFVYGNIETDNIIYGGKFLDAGDGVYGLDPGGNTLTNSSSLYIAYGAILAASSGNVGIGTTNPSSFKLQIAGSVGPNATNSYDLGSSTLQWRNVYAQTLYQNSSSLDSLYVNVSSDTMVGTLYFANGTSYYVDSSGNAKFLDIIAADTGNPGLTVGNGTTGYAKIGGSLIYDANGDLTLDSDSGEVYIPDNVGIGTTGPSYVLDVKARSSVGSATFTGTGLNDMTSGGTFTGSSALNYKVEIDATGTPDTFKWSDDGGATWDATGVAITGSAQTLNNGVTVTFGATTGHTLGDYWTFSTTVTNPLAIQNAAGTRSLYVGNDGNVGIGTTGPLYKLDVAGNGRFTSTLTIETTNDDQIYFKGTPTNVHTLRYDNKDFRLWTPGTGEVVRFTTGGNVGIGTTGPTGKLHLSTGPLIIGTDEDRQSSTGIFLGKSEKANYIEFLTSSYLAGYGAKFYGVDSGGGITSLRLAVRGESTSWTDALTVIIAVGSSNGKVGIGTTSPENKLDVEGALAVGASYSGTYTAPSNGMIIEGNVGIGTTTPDTKLTIASPADANGIRIYGYDDQSSAYGDLEIDSSGRFVVQGSNQIVLTGNAYQNSGIFQTIGRVETNTIRDYSGGNLVLQDDTGNVGIGTTSPGYKLDVAGAAHASSFPTSSDARFKENIVQLTGVLDKLENIRGVAFDWNELYQSLGRSTGHREIGFIAQEVEQYFPEVVTTWGEENYRAIDYGRFSAVLTEGLKELNARTKSLETTKQGDLIIQGNVGIGTTSPAYKLDVLGSIRTDGQFISTAKEGTAPLSVSSTTKVDNLNADLLDGYHFDQLPYDNFQNWSLTDGQANTQTITSQSNLTFKAESGLEIAFTKAGELTFSLSPALTERLDNLSSSLQTLNDTFNIDTSTGNVGIGTATPSAKLDVDGFVRAKGYYTGHIMEENIVAGDGEFEDGQLLAISENNDSTFVKANKPYQSSLLGLASSDSLKQVKPVIAGRFTALVSNLNGPIKPGDPITSSQIPGLGMKATKAGTIVGKALEEFDPENGKGEVIECPASTPTTTFSTKSNIEQKEKNKQQQPINRTSRDDSIPVHNSPTSFNKDKANNNEISPLIKDVNLTNEVTGEIKAVANQTTAILDKNSANNLRWDSLNIDHNFNTSSNQKSTPVCGKIMVFVNVSWSDPDVYITSTGDLKIVKNDQLSSTNDQTNPNHQNSKSQTEYVYNGVVKQVQSSKFQLLNSAGEVIDRIGAFSELISAKIKAGLIETENAVVNNLLVAKNIVAETIRVNSLKISENLIANKLVSPVVETTDLEATGTAKLSQVETKEIKPENQDLVINLSGTKTSDTGDLGGKQANASEAGPAAGASNTVSSDEKGPLAKIIIRGLEGKTVAQIDASGNASFSGQISANSLQVNKNATVSGQLAADKVTADQLVSHQATISGQLAANNLTSKQATIEGKLVAKEIESENIKSLTRTVLEQGQSLENINEIQKLLAEIKNQPLPDLTSQTNLANTLAADRWPNGLSSADDKQNNTLSLQNLTATGNTNLYNLSVANSATVGSLFFQDNQILSLSWELKLSALSRINLFDGAVTIAKDGTITTKGELIAQGGIKTNQISPISANDDLSIVLNSNHQIPNSKQLKNSKLKIENQLGDEVASIDASGSAYFKQLALEKFTPATPSAAVIAAPDNFIKNGLYAPAIDTATASAGLAVLPENESQIIIYNDNVAKNSLIYLTPTSPIGEIQLSVLEKKNGYFTVSSNQETHPEIKFDWLIIN